MAREWPCPGDIFLTWLIFRGMRPWNVYFVSRPGGGRVDRLGGRRGTSKFDDDSDLRFFALASSDFYFQSFKEYEMKELYVGYSQKKKRMGFSTTWYKYLS
jgi:hypothetical protein